MNEEHRIWISRAIEGKLSEAESVELQTLLKQDKELRRQYIRQCRVEGLLKEVHGGLIQKQSFIAPKKKKTFLPWFYAAALLALSVSAYLFSPNERVLIEELNPGPVARVVISENSEYQVGQLLMPGDFKLESGKVHVVMDSGVELIFSDKTKARLDNAMRVHLSEGKASVEVPEPARGFQLTTSQMNVDDLGTSFGVDASSPQHEVHVFKGKVVVTPSSLDRVREKEVTAGHAFRVSEKESKELDRIDYLEEQFDRAFSDPKPIEEPYAHYSFNGHLKDSGTHALNYHGEFLRMKDGTEALAPWKEGSFGQALHITSDFWVQTPYAGVSGSEPRSVSLWIKVLPSQRFTKPASILAWGHGRASQKKWQVMLDGGQGGALRVSLGKGFIVGSTDLQDGRWHHVCAVFLGGEKADIRTHLRLYVDGKLEVLGKTQLQSVDTGVDEMMVIGQNITHRHDPERTFRGMLDELYIFEEALHPNQVELLGSNRLPEQASF